MLTCVPVRQMARSWMTTFYNMGGNILDKQMRNRYTAYMLMQLELNRTLSKPFDEPAPDHIHLPLVKIIVSVIRKFYDGPILTNNTFQHVNPLKLWFAQSSFQDADTYIQFFERCEKYYLTKKGSSGDQEMEDICMKPSDFLYRLPPIQSGVVVYGACFSKNDQWKHPSPSVEPSNDRSKLNVLSPPFGHVASSAIRISYLYHVYQPSEKHGRLRPYSNVILFVFLYFICIRYERQDVDDAFIISNHDFNGFRMAARCWLLLLAAAAQLKHGLTTPYLSLLPSPSCAVRCSFRFIMISHHHVCGVCYKVRIGGSRVPYRKL